MATYRCNMPPAEHQMSGEDFLLFESKLQHHPVHPQQMGDGGFAENIKAMSLAEQSFAKYQAEARLARATQPLLEADP